MANITVNTTDTGGFTPALWANRALDILKPKLSLAKVIAKDADFEVSGQGKSVTIPFPGTFGTAGTKAADGSASVSVPSGGTGITVTMDQHRYVDFIIEDVAKVQSNPTTMDRYIDAAMTPIANAIEDTLLARYAGFSTSIGTSGTDVTAALVRTARKTLSDADVPSEDRHLFLDPKDIVALLGSSDLSSYFANANPAAIEEGAIARLYGFTLWEHTRIPVVAGSPNSTKNLALHRDALILASRPLEAPDAGTGVIAATVVDDETGLAFRILKTYDFDARGHRIGIDVLFGTAELSDTRGLVVLS